MKYFLKMLMLLGLVVSEASVFAFTNPRTRRTPVQPAAAVPVTPVQSTAASLGASTQPPGSSSGTSAQLPASSLALTRITTTQARVLDQEDRKAVEALNQKFGSIFYDIDRHSLLAALDYRIAYCEIMINATNGDFSWIDEQRSLQAIKKDNISRPEDRERLRKLRDELMLKFIKEIEVAREQEAFASDEVQARDLLEQEEAKFRNIIKRKDAAFKMLNALKEARFAKTPPRNTWRNRGKRNASLYQKTSSSVHGNGDGSHAPY